MNWFKLYSEFASDPKVQSMSEAMQRRLVMLYCLKCQGDIAKLDDEEIALYLRITPAELEKTRDLFRRKGFIGDGWSIPKWELRQKPSDPTAAERMRRMRANKVELVTDVARNGAVTDVVTMSGVTRTVLAGARPRSETDTETERELDSVCVSPAHAREGSDLADWSEAMAELQGDPDSRLIAAQLQDHAEVPSVAGLEAWRFIHAAHVMQGRPEKTTWAFFMGVARRASRQEFDAWHDPPARTAPALNGHRKAVGYGAMSNPITRAWAEGT